MEIERNLNSYAQMVRWFSPHLLVLAAYRDTVARIFGEFADQRGIQHVADPIPTDEELKKKFCNRYDYSGQAGGSTPYWVDFAADLGDGFDSTYSVAYLLAADKLHPEQARTTGGIRGIKGLAGSEPLEHGRLLILSGDEVYPWPTHEDYELKTFKPYAMALSEPAIDPQTGRLPPASRHVFAIPGNHDWYDGLNAFDDQFCRARAGTGGGMRFGDWETRQHRSSFAIKLPHNWWIWGADIQLNDLLDPGQLSYFRAVAEQMGPEDRFILCTAEPSWYALGTPAERFARQNLNGLIEAPIRRGAKLCGIFSGDWHHYSRYNESQALGNMNLITAGGAGAYIHGTYHLKRKLDFEWVGKTLEFRLDRKLEPSGSDTEPPKQTTANACYPSKATSYRLALGNWLFPFRNFGFCLAVGIVYWLLTWTFATLRIDFWLEVPKDQQITRGLIQTPQAVRECLEPTQRPQQQRTRSNVATGDVKSCLLDPGPERNGYRPFNGTGRIEDWTLQLIDFYIADIKAATSFKQMADNTGYLFLKCVHLLLLGMINSVGAALFLFGIWFAFFAITQSKYRGKRGLASRVVVATLHHGTHLLFMWGLYCAFAYFNNTWLERHLDILAGTSASAAAPTLLLAPVPFWVSFIYPFEMVLIGGTLGGLIFGLYLMVTYIFGKVNCDWLFSSQRLDGYRCFLRMKFEPDKLTIYPIRLDAVPPRTGWRWRRNPGPREPLVEPISPLKPRLIEGPIVIRPDEVRNIART
jgi:hypothetical protein